MLYEEIRNSEGKVNKISRKQLICPEEAYSIPEHVPRLLRLLIVSIN